MKHTKKSIESTKTLKGHEETKKTICLELPPKALKELKATQKLLEKVEPNKIRKMVRDIRAINHGFHEYLGELHLNTIKFEDIISFEERYLKEQSAEGQDRKGKKRLIERVKGGFEEFRRRLQEYEFTDFVNEMNYYTSTFEREARKLEKMGQEYEGLQLVRVPLRLVEDLEQSELQNGVYSQIDRNLIRKTILIEEAEHQFKKAFSTQEYFAQ